MFAFRTFELVAAVQICIQNWKTFPMIFTRKHNKIKHQILDNRIIEHLRPVFTYQSMFDQSVKLI